jgi:tetratricopeptide (TPR) repeat protein
LTLFRQNRYDAAIQILAPEGEADSADPELLSLLADAYEQNNRTPQAVATLQGAIKRYPRQEQLYLQLAELCADHGSYGLAEEVLNAGAHNIGQSARLHTATGVVYAQLGRFEESASEFEKASRLTSDNELAAMGLNLTLQQEGRLAEAVQLLREQVQKNPAQPNLNYMLAQALIRRGIAPGSPDFDEARQALERAIEADSTSARSYAALGQLYLRGGATEAAIKQLERSLGLDPAQRTASYQLMLALRKAGRNEEAAALTEKVRHLVDEARQKEVEKGRYQLIRAAGPSDQ